MVRKTILLMLAIIVIMLAMIIIAVNNAKALDLQEWFEEEAMRLNEKKIMYDPYLKPYDQMTEKQAHDRVYWLGYYAEKLNYMYPGIHPRRVWKDTFAIVAVESWFVNWKEPVNMSLKSMAGTGRLKRNISGSLTSCRGST